MLQLKNYTFYWVISLCNSSSHNSFTFPFHVMKMDLQRHCAHFTKDVSVQSLLLNKITHQFNLKEQAAPWLQRHNSSPPCLSLNFKRLFFLRSSYLQANYKQNHLYIPMSVPFKASRLFICLVSAGELQGQSFVLLILGSPEVSLHQST